MEHSKNQKTQQPPKWLTKIASYICAPHLREELLGDLQERYEKHVRDEGRLNGRLLYFKEVMSLCRPSIFLRKSPEASHSPLFNLAMIENYFKISSRVLLKNKGYSLIHLIGLSVGLWACMMVGTVVIDALSYDRQWTRSQDIYRITTINKRGTELFERQASSASVLAPELVRIYPEVETYSSFSVGDFSLKINQTDFNGVKTQVLHMDTTGWKMLDIPVTIGNPQKYAEGNSNIIISESYRNQYFKNENPVGKIIYSAPRYGNSPNPYLITGVMKDLPYNSHLRADVIWLHKNRVEPFKMDGFITFSTNYLLMKPGTDMMAFTEKVNHWYKGVVKQPNDTQFEFQPIQDIYLKSDFANGQTIKGNAKVIYVFSGVAILLLFIACVNFVNLSTGRALTRLKEAGIRKVLSGSRGQLIIQMLSETLLLFGAATVITAVVYYFSIHTIEQFLEHRLIQTFTGHWQLSLFSLLGILITAIITGFYPAWLISGLKPSNSLRGIFNSSSDGRNWLRKGLVVAQFAISTIVLIATIVVRQQINFMETKDLGYNPQHLLNIEDVSWEGKSTAFKNEVLRISGVQNATLTRWYPAIGGHMTRDVEVPVHSGNKVKVWYISGDIDLIPTLGLKLTKGRYFGPEFGSDVVNTDSLSEKNFMKMEEAFMQQLSLITEHTAKILGIKNLNQKIEGANTLPIGIIQDFNNESLLEPLKPTIILAQREVEYGGMLIRVHSGSETHVTEQISKLWKQAYPYKFFEIKSVNEILNEDYKTEARMRQLFMFFTTLTLFLSALGIFGLTVQISEQRAKEVGIRKVLGASVSGIVSLLSKDFVKLVILGIIIASPIAWYALHKWLETYPYRINIQGYVFILAGSITIIVTLLTVSFNTIKAAFANPVKSLRNQ